MAVVVRPAVAGDAPGMAKVVVDTWLSAHRGQIPEHAWRRRAEEWTYDESEAGWRDTIGRLAVDNVHAEYVYVATDPGGAVVGVAMGRRSSESTPAVAEVNLLYVAERRMGIGRRLVAAIASELARAGMSSLHIGVLEANAPARAFYERLGGRPVGERTTEEDGVLLPEVVYGWDDITALMAGG